MAEINATAKFAIRDRLEPDLLLQLHRAADAAVLDRTQRLRVQAPLIERGSSVTQLLRPQQAADVVGVEWKLVYRHASSVGPLRAESQAVAVRQPTL